MPAADKTRFTISLPLALVREVEAVRKEQYRSRSEVVREALRAYFRLHRLPEERPTPRESAAIRRGRAAFARGDYVSLKDVRHDVDRSSRRPRT